MKKGDEPLRSFGDLMQFYTQQDEPAKPEGTAKPEASVGKGDAAKQDVKSEDASVSPPDAAVTPPPEKKTPDHPAPPDNVAGEAE